MKISAALGVWICAIFALVALGVVGTGLFNLDSVTEPAQRAHDVLLPHQGREILGAPLARKYLIAHRVEEMRGEPNPRHLQGPAVAASFRT